MSPTNFIKKHVLPYLPYVLFFFVFANICEAIRLAPGSSASDKMLGIMIGCSLAFRNPLPGNGLDVLIGLIGAALMRFAVYVKGKNAKKYRQNMEYGSARWGA